MHFHSHTKLPHRSPPDESLDKTSVHKRQGWFVYEILFRGDYGVHLHTRPLRDGAADVCTLDRFRSRLPRSPRRLLPVVVVVGVNFIVVRHRRHLLLRRHLWRHLWRHLLLWHGARRRAASERVLSRSRPRFPTRAVAGGRPWRRLAPKIVDQSFLCRLCLERAAADKMRRLVSSRSRHFFGNHDLNEKENLGLGLRSFDVLSRHGEAKKDATLFLTVTLVFLERLLRFPYQWK